MDRDQQSSSGKPCVVLDEATAAAVRDFRGRLSGLREPVDVLVFGSYARGDQQPESDIDVALIFDGTPGDRYGVLRDLSDVAYDVLLDRWLRIHPLPLWAVELERPELFSNPTLIAAIKRDGVRP